MKPTLISLIIMTLSTLASAAPDDLLVFIGTTPTDPLADSAGIYSVHFNTTTGALSELKLVAKARRSAWVAVHPTKPLLYAVNEVVDAAGNKSGGIDAYNVDPIAGTLTHINQESSKGIGPCFVEVDPAGRNVLTANFPSGNIAVLPIDDTGKLMPASSTDQHEGKGPNPTRQAGPHAHCLRIDPSGHFALSCDLGTDRIYVYKLDAATGKLTPNDPPYASVTPGIGPRHIAFTKNNQHIYVSCEMAGAVTTLSWDADKGVLKQLETLSTLPEDFKDANTVAQVDTDPAEHFLYVSNRGHDSLAVFKIDPTTARLTPAGRYPSEGKVPRHFAIEPTGKFMLLGNQNTNELIVFKVDPTTGALAPTGVKASVPAPTCIRFWLQK